VVSDWEGGFQAAVTVTADAPISGWTVTWTYTDGRRVDRAWNADVSSDGDRVTASDLGWNGALDAGDSAEFGFTGSGSGAHAAPQPVCAAD
jgi:endoglucanase